MVILKILVIFAFFPKPDPYSGTWTRTREPGPVLGNLQYSFMYSKCRVRETKKGEKISYFCFFCNKKF